MAPDRIDSASLFVKASPRRAYDAFATADAILAWLPPEGMTGRALSYAFREGGSYGIELRYVRSAEGKAKTSENTDVTRGRFLSLEPGRRIVQTGVFSSDKPEFAGEMTLSWSFDPAPGGTHVTVRAEQVPVGVTQADHEAGLASSLENLARYLEETAPREARTVSVHIERAPSDVYEYVVNPAHLPRWSFIESVSADGDAWQVTTPNGKARLRFAPKNEYGVLDHWVRLDENTEAYSPMRVIANGAGSELMFTVLRMPGQDDATFARDVATVEKDLAALKAILESR